MEAAALEAEKRLAESKHKHTSGCNILNQIIDERDRQLASMYEIFQSMCENRNPIASCKMPEAHGMCAAHWQDCPLTKEEK
jgi:hypothetical protein